MAVALSFAAIGLGDRVDRNSLVPVDVGADSTIDQVAAGDAFSVVVTADGKLWTWGANDQGQLGLGDLRDRSVPTQVKGALANREVAVVAAGGAHVLVMTTDGELWTWGDNSRSQLGLGRHTVRQPQPTHLQGAITGIKFVWAAAGAAHTLAVSRSGEVYSWGDNSQGQLGLGDLEERATPHAIMHKFTRSKITRVAAGATHSLAVTAEGDLFAWGGNECGQLGFDSKGNSRKYVGYPKRIEAIRAARIKASARASLAVLSSGKVFVWGCSKNGELGFGDTSTRPAPHNVNTPSNIPFTDVAFGSHHVLAVNRRGELYGWGKNGQGQLGLAYNTRTELKQVLIASGASADVTGMATGGFGYEYQGHSLATTSTGNVFVWGWNAFGQLGLGTIDHGTATPTRLFALEAPFLVGPMAAGQYNTMVAAARKGKTPNTFTWGPNFNSQLGHQFLELGPLPTPSKLDLLKTANIVQVEMGYAHALALGADGTLYAWGANSFGQLGTGDSKERSKPTPVTTFHGTPVVRIAAGQHSSYALTATGQVYAWGFNGHFELGLGEGTHRNSPQLVRALEARNVTTLAAGGYHAMAVTGSGGLFTWGANQYGQLGLGHRAQVREPQRVEGMPAVAAVADAHAQLAAVAAGVWHSAAVTAEGDVWTWGRDSFGQLGHGARLDGADEGVAVPTRVVSLEDSVASGVACGAAHTLAAAAPGKSWDL